ncbi:MAG: MFS transporter [Anaerolineales bacterium]|nr:MFS transporter [Anaerolineales bacterium]
MKNTETAVLTVTILSTGMVYLDQSALNVAIPHIQTALNADVAGFQWIVNIYILTLSVLLMIGGALGDRYGRVRMLILGTLIFTFASVLCGVANSLEMLIAARGLQGVGGALLVPGGLAIINATVPAQRRGQALGIWGTFSPLIVMLGPLVGGWLTDAISWRAIFFINIPLGLLACWLAWRYVPESRDETATGRLDWPGVLTLMLGLGALLFGLIEGPQLGWANALVFISILTGLLSLAAFVFIEARSPAPLMPLHLFRNRAFSGINALTLLHYFGLSSIFFFLTLNFQQVQGYGAFEAGLHQLPIPFCLFLMSRLAGRLTDRIGPQRVMTFGILLASLGFLVMLIPGADANYWLTFFPGQLLFGIGNGLTFVPLTSIALGSLPARYSGVASGLNNAVSRVAQMLAVAIFGMVMLSTFRTSLTEQTQNIPMSADARTQLAEQASNLGATQAPASLESGAAQAVQAAVKLAFVQGWRNIMLISFVLVLVGIATYYLFVGLRPAPTAPQPEATPLSLE